MALPTRQDGYTIRDDDWNAHVSAINANTSGVSSLDGRVASNDNSIGSLDSRVTDLENSGGGSSSFGAWQTPTFLSGWSPGSGARQSLRFRSAPGNQVQIVGVLNCVDGADSAAFNLPSGFRPSLDYIDIAITFISAEVRQLIVHSGGVVDIYGMATNETISLNVTVPLD